MSKSTTRSSTPAKKAEPTPDEKGADAAQKAAEKRDAESNPPATDVDTTTTAVEGDAATESPENKAPEQGGEPDHSKAPGSSVIDVDALKAANEPGGRPGEVLPRPDQVDGLSSAKATPLSGAPGGLDDVRAASGPLEAPSDRLSQTYPAKGYELSSTDATYAASGGRTVAGEQFHSLVDENGNEVAAADLFEGDEGKTYVIATKRVYEQFLYPNTTELMQRLLFVAGQQVSRAEAERIKATL